MEYRLRDVGTNAGWQGQDGRCTGRDRAGEGEKGSVDGEKMTGETTRVIQITGTADLRRMRNLRLFTRGGRIRAQRPAG